MGRGATGYIQPVGKWDVRRGVRMFGEERGFKGTAARMHVTWVERQVERTLRVFGCVVMPVQEISLWT